MSQIPNALLEAALQLPGDVRIELAERLFESVDGPSDGPVELHPDWSGELRRRLDDLEAGRDEAIPSEQALKMIFDESGDDDESAPG